MKYFIIILIILIFLFLQLICSTNKEQFNNEKSITKQIDNTTINIINNNIWTDDFKNRFINHEPQSNLEMSKLLNELPNNTYIIDVGGHVGDTGLYLAKVLKDKYIFKNINVIIIEPDNTKIDFIQKMIKLNNLNNVILKEYAVGNETKMVSIDKKTHPGGWTINKDLKSTIKLDKIDNICKNYNVSLMHIDVEGMEYECLLGSQNTIKNTKYIMIELNHLNNRNNEKIFFKNNNFKEIMNITNENGNYLLKNISNTKENFNNNKKNIIFTSAGDNTNFHNNWVGNNQNYDIWVVYYGNSDEKYNLYKNKVKFIEKRKGSKFQNFNYVWNKYYNELNNYDHFFILDDDIIFDSYNDINKMFNLAKEYNSWIIAPTFKINGSSKISHEITKSQNNKLLRYVNFIEVNVPLFNKYAINKFMKYYDDILIGWGIDYFYIWALGKDIKDKYILVDDISVINPHDNKKNNRRENTLVKNFNKEIDYWNNIKQKYNIKEWKHKTWDNVKLN